MARPPPPVEFGQRTPTPGKPPSSNRKRSAAVTLLALGAGATAIYAYANRRTPEEPVVEENFYQSLNECRTAGKTPVADCEAFWADAGRAHEKAAPRFPSMADCTAQFGAGNCTAPQYSTASTAAAVFIPVVAGVMLGKLGSGAYQSAALYRQPGDAPGQFRPSGAAAPCQLGQVRRIGADGLAACGPASSSSSRSSSSVGYWSRSRPAAATQTVAASRGGFGSTARSFSSRSSST